MVHRYGVSGVVSAGRFCRLAWRRTVRCVAFRASHLHGVRVASDRTSGGQGRKMVEAPAFSRSPARASGAAFGAALRVALGSTLGVAMVASCTVPLRAADDARTVDLRATSAPLASALEHLAGLDGREVRVSDDVRDRISGRLAGRADELIELLVDTHGLSVYADADTVWFDREGRRVVDFVRLESSLVDTALDALARPLGVGGTALRDASGKGLVLSGTRAYVESSLARVMLATASGETAERSGVGGPAAGTPDAEAPDSAALVVGEVVAGGGGPDGRAAEGASAAAAVSVPDVPVTIRLSLEQPETDELLGARIALVSAEPPRNVVLDDGRRLALGESLPNGHRIVAIERERIVTERDGGLTVVALPE